MTVTYGFYDSVNNDRRYNAMEFSRLFDSIINDGVFGSIGQAFHVGAGTGLHVTVGTGRAWFKHSWTYNDAVETLTIDTPHVALDRIDSVVIEIDSSEEVRANSIKILKGTAATTPVAPTLTHTATVNQYPFANILVVHGSTQILVANITNKIGTTDCPLVTGILAVMSIESIVAQWQAQFEFWFDTLVDELTENQAANLQSQITENNNTLIEEIISTGVNNEFTFDNIPAGFDHLRLVGMLKYTSLGGGYDGIMPAVRVNDDDGPNYSYEEWANGQWVGWGSNTSVHVMPVVTNQANDSEIYTYFQLDFPFYASPSILKWIINRNVYGATGNMNPSPGDGIAIRNIWRNNDPITKIVVPGTFVATLSHLKLFGCALGGI